MIVRLSPTRLSRWFDLGCPAAWKFDQEYTPVAPNHNLILGGVVHKLLEGTLNQKSTPGDVTLSVDQPVGDALWTQALGIFHKLLDFKSDLGLTVAFDPLGHPLVEVKYEWRITKDIQMVCVIDFIGYTAEGKLVVVDYKSTLGSGWRSFKVGDGYLNGTPQAFGFQSPAYLIPPPKRIRDRLGIDSWPETLYYLVGPARGPCQVFMVEKDDEAYANFKTALSLAANAIQDQAYPKIKGRHCFECPYRAVCYQEPDWQAAYLRRTEGGHGTARIEPVV